MSEKKSFGERPRLGIFAATLAAIAAMNGGGSTTMRRLSFGGSVDLGDRSAGMFAASRNGRQRWKKTRQSGYVQMRRHK